MGECGSARRLRCADTVSVRAAALAAGVTLVMVMLNGCTTGEVRYAPSVIAGRQLSDRQHRLVRSAHDLIGVDWLYVGGTEYRDDCTGAVYAAAGINLGARFHRYQGNGVSRLYEMMRDHHLYFPAAADVQPAPGDIVFFDNTWDRNGNRRWDDTLTHMRLVGAVDRPGTISYLHNHVRRGVIIEQMNLRHPDARQLNAPLRLRGAPRDGSGRWLASHLVRGFGSAYLLPT